MSKHHDTCDAPHALDSSSPEVSELDPVVAKLAARTFRARGCRYRSVPSGHNKSIAEIGQPIGYLPRDYLAVRPIQSQHGCRCPKPDGNHLFLSRSPHFGHLYSYLA